MKKLLFLFFVLISVSCSAHKYYVSIANMEYDSSRQRINVSLTMTAHDFELVLMRKFDRKIELENVADTSDVGLYIQQYLEFNFQVFSGEQQLKMNYLGKEVNNKDELSCYFFFSEVKDYNAIKIMSKLLFSISDQQQNIVHYKCLGRTKSVTLIPSENEQWITFKEHEDD